MAITRFEDLIAWQKARELTKAIYQATTTIPATVAVLRTPHPDIAGKVIIKGDIIGSIPSSDWDLLQ